MKNTDPHFAGIPGAMIAPSEQVFMDLLFTGPATADGYIVRTRKTGCIDFCFRNHDLTLSARGCILFRFKFKGRTHFRFTNKHEWPFSWSESEAFISAMRKIAPASLPTLA